MIVVAGGETGGLAARLEQPSRRRLAEELLGQVVDQRVERGRSVAGIQATGGAVGQSCLGHHRPAIE